MVLQKHAYTYMNCPWDLRWLTLNSKIMTKQWRLERLKIFFFKLYFAQIIQVEKKYLYRNDEIVVPFLV
jgi:hypothetical protein